jgi:hypothetical protein
VVDRGSERRREIGRPRLVPYCGAACPCPGRVAVPRQSGRLPAPRCDGGRSPPCWASSSPGWRSRSPACSASRTQRRRLDGRPARLSSRPSRCRSAPGSWTDGNPSPRSTTRTGSTSRSPDLAEDGQGDRRDRGLPLLPARRLDLKGTLRALVTNQASRRRRPGWLVDHPADGQADPAQPGQDQGARKAATDDTYARKLRELRYAIAFEQNYSKDWILERYLNIAYFGDGAYGIQAAARGTTSTTNAKDLTCGRRPLLAGLVKNPVGYDPTNNPDRRPLERATSCSTGWPS